MRLHYSNTILCDYLFILSNKRKSNDPTDCTLGKCATPFCAPIVRNARRVNKLRAHTVYPKKYAHGFCFVVLCCGYTLTDFPISIRLTSLALWQSNDCPSASKATLMNMDKYFMGIHYERLHNHNKAKHNKTVCIFLGIYCIQNQSNMHAYTMHALKNRTMLADSQTNNVAGKQTEIRLYKHCTITHFNHTKNSYIEPPILQHSHMTIDVDMISKRSLISEYSKC